MQRTKLRAAPVLQAEVPPCAPAGEMDGATASQLIRGVGHHQMDYTIRRARAELDSTGYIEIGPGRYSGAHWQDGFLFVWEDAFGMAEGILAKHLVDYDHFGTNDLPSEVGRRVTAEWREVAKRLCSMTAEQAHAALNLGASYTMRLDGEVIPHQAEIAHLLTALADACDGFYEQQEWVCILGV
jgi:hypothetical protein